MSADWFDQTAKGKTAKEAFYAARERALYDYGHAGYTGTIAEKHDCKEFALPTGLTIREVADALECSEPPDHWSNEAKQWFVRVQAVADDKWGPAVAIKCGEDKWYFCGLASS